MNLRAEAFAIFEAVFSHPEHEQQELIAQRCQGRPKLLEAIQQLLAASVRSKGFLEPPPTPQKIPNVEGYSLLHSIGEGGMGQVWLAERNDGAYQQKVAIKFLRAHPSDLRLRERALLERQFLANLKHPGIAQILDAGSTSDDVPFVVMEYVEGEPIDRYAERRALSCSARVSLFLQVLDAVDAAHRALILHRDLKSANIMVDAQGQAKLLDFGIAKSLASDSSEHRSTAMLLTPATASPEQLEGKTLTIASDLYSAGLLLYKLLTGSEPINFQGGLLEHARTLARTTLPRASERFDSQALSLPAPQAKAWQRALRGDLEAILAKALRYEPELRYRNAREFAADLQAWLEQRPVQAHAGGAWYRWRKFFARNRPLLAASSTGFTALCIGLILAWQQSQARLVEAERAHLAKQFLSEMIASSDPFATTGSLTVAQAMDRASADLNTRFAKQPLLEAELRIVLGQAYLQLNELVKAERHLTQAHTLLRAQQQTRGQALLQCLTGLGELHWFKGELTLAEARFLEAIAVADAKDPAQQWLQSQARGNLAQLLVDLGRVDEGIALARTNLDRWQMGPNDAKQALLRKAELLGNLGYIVSFKPERLPEAITYYQQSRAHFLQALPNDNLNIASSLNNEGMAWLELNDLPKAAQLLEQSLAIRRKQLDRKHWMQVTGPLNLARVKARLGEHQSACDLMQETLQNAVLALAPKDTTWPKIAHGLAFVSYQNQDWAKAIAFSERAIVMTRAQGGYEPRIFAELQQWLQEAQRETAAAAPKAAFVPCDLSWPQ